jgi:uncharacterized protein with GYD domain
MQWDYPEGVKPVAECRLQTDDPSVISVVELDNVGPLTALRMAWDDLFEIQASPPSPPMKGWRCSGRWRPRSGTRSEPLYMTQFSHTPEAWAALATNPEDRSEAVSRMAESAGGCVLSFHFSFGDYDGVTISEAPDDKTAATIALVVASTGHLKNLKTTTLFSVDETMEVLRRVGEISYQGPGQ